MRILSATGATLTVLATSVLALSTGAAAGHRPHGRHPTVHYHARVALDGQIKALEAKVKALTERLDQQEAAQQTTAQHVRGAQATTTTAAQVRASAALTQTQAGQAQVVKVQNEVLPLEKAVKDSWFANTTVGAKSFFNVSDIHQISIDATGKKTKNVPDGTQTELKRAYVIIDHKFNDVFSANITTDFRYGSNGLTKDTTVFVKKAYIQAKLDPALLIRIGESDLAWVPFAEGLYGFRFVENTLIDRTKFGTSTDWGVHVSGALGNNFVTYQVSAINGQGYKTLARSSDRTDVEGRIGVNPTKNIALGVGAYVGKLGKIGGHLAGTATPHKAKRVNAVGVYTDKRIRLGVEYFAAKNWNNVTTSSQDKSDGWTTFGSFAFTPQIIAFARYDWVTPSKDLTPALKDHYYNVGLDYKPLPPLDFALVYKRDRANNGTIATSNGTIGGSDYGTYGEFGLFGQLVF
jgi:hypothetical protein